MYRILISLIISMAFFVTHVGAATLQVTQGSVVSVNRGQGFEPVNGTTTVNPGDVVNVPPGSNAQIVYPDGSIQSVQPGNLASVGPGASAPASGSVTLTQAAPPAAPAPAAAAAGGGLTGTTLAAAAAAVGIGVGVAVYVASQGASP